MTRALFNLLNFGKPAWPEKSRRGHRLLAAARLEHIGEGIVARLIIFADVLKTDIAHGKPPLHPQAGSKNKCLLLFLCCPKKNAG